MANEVIIHKGRTNVISVDMGVDVSTDVLTSEIRTEPDQNSPLLATFVVDFVTDGIDGEITLTLDNTITGQITVNTGYMDIKRVVNGEPMPVFDKPLEVSFRGTVTV